MDLRGVDGEEGLNEYCLMIVMIPIYTPYLSKYKTSAIHAIESEWISNHGLYVQIASNRLAHLLGTTYCILMNNGTSATHCLFKALKFKYPSLRKIYVPNHVFVAPWNCCLMEFSETMVEVMKTNPDTLNMVTDEDYILSLDADSAICIVHNLGNIVNVPRLKRLRPDLIFVEDNCEGLFGKYEGVYAGTSSMCSAVSFYGNKTITTGEGGAFFTDDEDIYNYIKSIYSHGMTETRYIHCHIASNFRMTNIQAAFLHDQLEDIEHILHRKHTIFENYNCLLQELINSCKIHVPQQETDTEHSTWMYSILIPSCVYEDIEHYMKQHYIEIRPVFYDVHEHTHLKQLKKHNSVDTTAMCGILLPSYPSLEWVQQQYIVQILKNFINSHT